MLSVRALVVVATFLAASTGGEAVAAAPKDTGPVFDKVAASSALGSVDLSRCKATNAKRGEGHVTVTFAPQGTASSAVVDRGPMVGTPVQKCIEMRFKLTKVPAFKGASVQVGKTFRFE
jgi:hypothetical protein